VTILTFIFSVIFVGVGAVSLSYGSAFAEEVNMYCEVQCVKSLEVVGCSCDTNPPKSLLPYYFFLSPSIGLVVVGVFIFLTSILGCRGAIKERSMVLSLYLISLTICIILQFGFGVAAAAVSTGNAPEVEGPLMGVLGRKYKEFDWITLDLFFPAACYQGSQSKVQQDPYTDEMKSLTYHFPLCNFDGDCVLNDQTADPTLRAQQDSCCLQNGYCATANPQCISGSACVRSFLGKVGAPVAVVAFLALCIEITAFVFASVIRFGRPDRFDRDEI